MHSDEMGLGTLLSHLGEEEKVKGAVVSPIFQNSLFLFDTCDDLHKALTTDLEGPPFHYSRISNPSVAIAEKKIAALEGAEACKLCGTGQGAIALAILSVVAAGAHVIAPDTCYGPVRSMLSEMLQRFGVSYTFVDGRDPVDFIDAIRPETTLIYLESPSSLLFRLQDVDAITKVARERGITTIIDNTYNTPIHYNPIKHGVDIVCHSASKYLGGHSDLTAGALCTTRERMNGIVRHELNYIGSILHPFTAWLLTRGLRTLPLRLKRHESTGNIVARWLETRPEIDRVHHISLDSFPQRELFLKSFSGSGGLFSFEPKVQDPIKIKAFCDSLSLFGRGVSWGGFESLVVPLPITASGVPDGRWFIRLFCGLEEPGDLVSDLERAMHLLA
ncbi:trans-sulfuration enzyme family protein [Fimbriimonas ginsengisoli]|uniref:homocysteine desulfhydrase n=1 Tax=Fimbriimonas ginsengisoli Gsoil 348 TaxID=661478 RepID=A0A068NXN9_FIMGI|nr:PLP-dependent aspartate aminotransferase family protein [Fimbriimonas ginsengisoli]AIE88092.1 Cys/Met metabolism pyridoxal-phosphate-dependent protein [Fimbriimonas ginsengisoli Gsoil 348]